MARYVYRFGEPLEDGAAGAGRARALLGGKGAGLAEMTRLGVPVPPGFTLSSELCSRFLPRESRDAASEARNDSKLGFDADLRDEVEHALSDVEQQLDRRFGGSSRPLLVSVRSGAMVSMPGMMDTVLNLGLNDETAAALAEETGDARFASDTYRRFIQMYGNVVLDIGHHHFEATLGRVKAAQGNAQLRDTELTESSLRDLIKRYKALIEDQSGASFPTDVREQLWTTITAVFRSWNNARAVRYRKMQGIDASIGTACTVQAMVFGNLGDDSGTGVAFSRNPSTGEATIFGEFLPHAQGEDLVAGLRTPLPLTASSAVPGSEANSFEALLPKAFESVVEHCRALETHFGDMQDVEFTVEAGKPFILQTRAGKRTARAAVRIAVDMEREGVINQDQAVLSVDASSLQQLLHAKLPPPTALAENGVHPIARGLPASPGAASGAIVFDADEAVERAAQGQDVVLVRRETSPEDIHGMKAARGILTASGGMTSHAAVVARGLGKCCVTGCGALQVDYATGTIRIPKSEHVSEPIVLSRGDEISVDGSHGRVYLGVLDVEAAATVPEFDVLMGWADKRRRMRVRANVDTPQGARTARSFGAQGIGLCRTEHMFFAPDRLLAVRCAVLATDDATREQWLERLEAAQREDFEGMFRIMQGLPITIRLLDWPLHEFLPVENADFESVAEALGIAVKQVRQSAHAMKEINPMLGFRGVRVGLTMPQLYSMQVRAIARAAVRCAQDGAEVEPEIMVPMVSLAGELSAVRSLVDTTMRAELERCEAKLPYRVGTMIELPRACLVADELAQYADFFSFGTNDLTQTTFGISRDDAAHFLPRYLDELGIMDVNPFVRLDRGGPGALMQIAAERGRSARSDLSLGVCGEHGGDPSSVQLCEELGLDYVSCSPPRLPIARLAAAQAALRRSSEKS